MGSVVDSLEVIAQNYLRDGPTIKSLFGVRAGVSVGSQPVEYEIARYDVPRIRSATSPQRVS
jgi:hypothetical protein